MSRLTHLAFGAVLSSVIVLNPTPVAHAQGPACDRACLRTTLDAYLNAVIKHDPAAAPLMIGFRQTENAVVVRPGNGLWKTMTGLGSMQRRYLDPVTGQAAYFGIIKEGSAEAVVTVRVKVDDRKISEAEWLLARAGEYGPNGPNGNVFNAESLAANPPPERTVPKAQRLSRASLLGITNSYFDGLTTHDGNIIEHEPGCTRVENGTVMTNRPGRNGGPPGGDCAVRPRKLQCVDCGGATLSDRRRRGAGGAGTRRVSSQARIAGAAQHVQRMVLHRQRQDSSRLFGDVLSAAGAAGAELAAV